MSKKTKSCFAIRSLSAHCPFVRLSFCPSVRPSVRPSVFLSVCLSVCLSNWLRGSGCVGGRCARNSTSTLYVSRTAAPKAFRAVPSLLRVRPPASRSGDTRIRLSSLQPYTSALLRRGSRQKGSKMTQNVSQRQGRTHEKSYQ